MGNLNIPPDKWMEELFEHENCDECGRGAEGHDAIPLMGNWFARCRTATIEPTGFDAELEQSIFDVTDDGTVLFSGTNDECIAYVTKNNYKLEINHAGKN